MNFIYHVRFKYIRIDVCKMYTKCFYTKCISHFKNFLYTFCMHNLAGVVLLILYTKCIQKFVEIWYTFLYTFCIYQLYTSCTIFVYKMYTQFPCGRILYFPCYIEVSLNFKLERI